MISSFHGNSSMMLFQVLAVWKWTVLPVSDKHVSFFLWAKNKQSKI
jgi:hypothetical protein